MTFRHPAALLTTLHAAFCLLLTSGCDFGKPINPGSDRLPDLRGTIVTPDGRPAAGARVRAHLPEAGLEKAGMAEDSARLADLQGIVELQETASLFFAG